MATRCRETVLIEVHSVNSLCHGGAGQLLNVLTWRLNMCFYDLHT